MPLAQSAEEASSRWARVADPIRHLPAAAEAQAGWAWWAAQAGELTQGRARSTGSVTARWTRLGQPTLHQDVGVPSQTLLG